MRSNNPIFAQENDRQTKESYWKKNKRQNLLTAFFFILPNLLGFVIFVAGPMMYSFIISFYRIGLLGKPEFIALENYRRLLTMDSVFWISLKNTLVYVIGYVSINIVVSMIISLWILNMQSSYSKFLRSVYFLPVMIVTVSSALVWRYMYITGGPIFLLVKFITGREIAILGNFSTALWGVIIASTWMNFGYNMVLFFAGLKNIPTSYIEAARIEGATGTKMFWKITLPLISPTVYFAVTMTMISSFQVFDQVRVMTDGGPGTATNTIVMLLYQNGFQYFRFGYASAIAWVLFLLIFTVTLIQKRIQGRRVVYE